MAMMSAVRSSIAAKQPIVLPPRKGQRRSTLAAQAARDGSRPHIARPAASTRRLGERGTHSHTRHTTAPHGSNSPRYRGDLAGAEAGGPMRHHHHHNYHQSLPPTLLQNHSAPRGTRDYTDAHGSLSPRMVRGPEAISSRLLAGDSIYAMAPALDQLPRGRSRGGSDAGIRTVPKLRIGRDVSPAGSEDHAATTRQSIRSIPDVRLDWPHPRPSAPSPRHGHQSRHQDRVAASSDTRGIPLAGSFSHQERHLVDAPPPMRGAHSARNPQSAAHLESIAEGPAFVRTPSAPAHPHTQDRRSIAAGSHGARSTATDRDDKAAASPRLRDHDADASPSPSAPEEFGDNDGSSNGRGNRSIDYAGTDAGRSSEAQAAYFHGLAMQQQTVIAQQQLQLQVLMQQQHMLAASAGSTSPGGVGFARGSPTRSSKGGSVAPPMRRVKTMSDAQAKGLASPTISAIGMGMPPRAAMVPPLVLSKSAGNGRSRRNFASAARAVIAAQRFTSAGRVRGSSNASRSPTPPAVVSGLAGGSKGSGGVLMMPAPLRRGTDSASYGSMGSILGTTGTPGGILKASKPGPTTAAAQKGVGKPSFDGSGSGGRPSPVGQDDSSGPPGQIEGTTKRATGGNSNATTSELGGGGSDGSGNTHGSGLSARDRKYSIQSIATRGQRDGNGKVGARSGWARWAHDTPCIPDNRGFCHAFYKVLSLTDSVSGQVFSNLIMLAIIMSVVIMCIESTREVREARLRGESVPVLSELELVAVILFTFELLGRVISSTSAPLIDLYGGANEEDDDEEVEEGEGGEYGDEDYGEDATAYDPNAAGEANEQPELSSEPAESDAKTSAGRALGRPSIAESVTTLDSLPGGAAAAEAAAEAATEAAGRGRRGTGTGTGRAIAGSKLSTAGSSIAGGGSMQSQSNNRLLAKMSSMYKVHSRSIDGVNSVLAERRKATPGDDEDDEDEEDEDQLRDKELSQMPVERLEASLANKLARANTPHQRVEAWSQYRRRLGLRGRRDTSCTWWCGALQRIMCPCCLDVPCKAGSACRSVWGVTCSPRARLKLWVFFTSAMNLIDFAAIVPFYVELLLVALGASESSDGGVGLQVLRVLRVARVLRVLKLGKRSAGAMIIVKAMEKSGQALVLTLFFVAMGIVLFGALLFFAESGEYDAATGKWMRADVVGSELEETPFHSIMASFWFCIASATTSGYGDLYPTSVIGKFVASALQFAGIVVLALPISIIGSNFTTVFREYQGIRGWKRMGYSTKQSKQLVGAGHFPEDVSQDAMREADAEDAEVASILGIDGPGGSAGGSQFDPWQFQFQRQATMDSLTMGYGQQQGLAMSPYGSAQFALPHLGSSSSSQAVPLSSVENRGQGVHFLPPALDPVSVKPVPVPLPLLPPPRVDQSQDVSSRLGGSDGQSSSPGVGGAGDDQPRTRFSIDRRLGTLVSNDADDDDSERRHGGGSRDASSRTLPLAAAIASPLGPANFDRVSDINEEHADGDNDDDEDDNDDEDDSIGSSHVSEVPGSDAGDLGQRPPESTDRSPQSGAATRDLVGIADSVSGSAFSAISDAHSTGGNGSSIRGPGARAARESTAQDADTIEGGHRSVGGGDMAPMQVLDTGIIAVGLPSAGMEFGNASSAHTPTSVGGAGGRGLESLLPVEPPVSRTERASSGRDTPEDLTDVKPRSKTTDSLGPGRSKAMVKKANLQALQITSSPATSSRQASLSTRSAQTLPSRVDAEPRSPPPAPPRPGSKSSYSLNTPGDALISSGQSTSSQRSRPSGSPSTHPPLPPARMHRRTQPGQSLTSPAIGPSGRATSSTGLDQASSDSVRSTSQGPGSSSQLRLVTPTNSLVGGGGGGGAGRTGGRRFSLPLVDGMPLRSRRSSMGDDVSHAATAQRDTRQLVAMVYSLQQKMEEMSRTLKLLAAQSVMKSRRNHPGGGGGGGGVGGSRPAATATPEEAAKAAELLRKGPPARKATRNAKAMAALLGPSAGRGVGLKRSSWIPTASPSALLPPPVVAQKPGSPGAAVNPKPAQE